MKHKFDSFILVKFQKDYTMLLSYDLIIIIMKWFMKYD